MRTRWFFAFFFVSGFCSLVYEVVWLRLSMAKFGVTTPMVSIVLSVFMAGLGIGSWAGGKFVRRFANSPAATALRLYAIVELIIGISGLCVPALLDFGYAWLRDAGKGLDWGSSFYYAATGGWVLLALLPWCICMGATFPFAMAAIRSLQGSSAQHSFSYLYLANVLGAILGALVPAFVLIELFGFRDTLLIASGLNALLAATVLALSLGVTHTAKTQDTPSEVTNSAAGSRMLLWQLFATGLCSMAMEVVWTREFTVYLGNVVYAFAAILALYLGATFVGSAGYRLWVKSHDPRDSAAAWIPLGFLALLPLLFADPRLPGPPISETGEAFFGLGVLRCALGIAPISGLIGFLTPMLVDRWSSGDPERAGKAYSVNVLGSILGPLLGGFLILPQVGERGGLMLISAPLFVIGAAAAFGKLQDGAARRSTGPNGLLACSIILSLVCIFFTEDYGARYPRRVEMRDYTANVIATGEGMHKHLLVNGMGMTILTPVTKIMAHLPLTMLGRPPKNALAICFGMGTSFRSMMSWGIPTTAVELVPSVPKLFGFYHADGPALLQSPLAHVVVDDGRRYLERSPERFDVIVVDPPPPVSAPTSGLLYSRQFYDVIKMHLSPGGFLQMWYPGGDDATRASITKALRDSFPYVRAFLSIQGTGFHFLARMEPIPDIDGDDLAVKLPPRAAADLVEWNPDWTAGDMLGETLDGEKTLESLIGREVTVPAMTDNHPINEYFLLRSATLQPK